MCFVMPKSVNMWFGILKTTFRIIPQEGTQQMSLDILSNLPPCVSLIYEDGTTQPGINSSVFGVEKSNCLGSEPSNQSTVPLLIKPSTDFWCFRMYVFFLNVDEMHKVKWGLACYKTIADQRQSLSVHQKKAINIGLKSFWMVQTKLDCALIDRIPTASNHSTSCWLKPASFTNKGLLFFFCLFAFFPPELTASMNCRWVNDVPVWESGGSGVISACLSHCDAAPYLTLLLFLQELCSSLVSGESEASQRTGKVKWRNSDRCICLRRKWGTEPKTERCLVLVYISKESMKDSSASGQLQTVHH